MTNSRTEFEVNYDNIESIDIEYLAEISPFITLDINLDVDSEAHINFLRKFSQLIPDKSLLKLDIFLSSDLWDQTDWASPDEMEKFITNVSLICDIEVIENVKIWGKEIKIYNLPDYINLSDNLGIFGKDQWIICKGISKYVEILRWFPQIYEKLWDSEYNGKDITIESVNELKELLKKERENNCLVADITDLYNDYYLQIHNHLTAFYLASIESIEIKDSPVDALINELVYTRVRNMLSKMQNLKFIYFRPFNWVNEVVSKLNFLDMQKNGRIFKLISNNLCQSYRYSFQVTVNAWVPILINECIKEFSFKLLENAKIDAYTWSSTFILDDRFLLWVAHNINEISIDWASLSKPWDYIIPKFIEKEQDLTHNLMIIPLECIKEISKIVCLNEEDKVFKVTDQLISHFDKKVCIPLGYSSKLFAKINEEAKIDIDINGDYNNDEVTKFGKILEEELIQLLPFSHRIRSLSISYIAISLQNYKTFISLLQGCARLNELDIWINESQEENVISSAISKTIKKGNHCLSSIKINTNREWIELTNLKKSLLDWRIEISEYYE